jgi:hypothetical protein
MTAYLQFIDSFSSDFSTSHYLVITIFTKMSQQSMDNQRAHKANEQQANKAAKISKTRTTAAVEVATKVVLPYAGATGGAPKQAPSALAQNQDHQNQQQLKPGRRGPRPTTGNRIIQMNPSSPGPGEPRPDIESQNVWFTKVALRTKGNPKEKMPEDILDMLTKPLNKPVTKVIQKKKLNLSKLSSKWLINSWATAHQQANNREPPKTMTTAKVFKEGKPHQRQLDLL